MRGPYKKQSLEVLKARNIDVKTILDVGILDGTPELISAFPGIKHVLFEPVAEFTGKIAEVYKNIPHELHTVAVSDRSGEATLQVRSIVAERRITHSNMVSATAAEGAGEFRKVPMTSLDNFVRGRGYSTPYLLKIDIDGHELTVLRGATELLKDTSVVIVEAPKSQLVERIAAVQNAGFVLFDLTEPVYYDESFWQCDAVFIRADLHRTHFKQLGDGFQSQLYKPFR